MVSRKWVHPSEGDCLSLVRTSQGISYSGVFAGVHVHLTFGLGALHQVEPYPGADTTFRWLRLVG